MPPYTLKTGAVLPKANKNKCSMQVWMTEDFQVFKYGLVNEKNIYSLKNIGFTWKLIQ